MRCTGGMLQVELPGGEGRAGGDAGEGFALVVGARGRAGQVHLDVQVGDIGFFDGDLRVAVPSSTRKRWV